MAAAPRPPVFARLYAAWGGGTVISLKLDHQLFHCGVHRVQSRPPRLDPCWRRMPAAEFWLKTDTYLEQPEVTYTKELLLLAEGYKGGEAFSASFATLAGINALNHAVLRSAVVKVRHQRARPRVTWRTTCYYCASTCTIQFHSTVVVRGIFCLPSTNIYACQLLSVGQSAGILFPNDSGYRYSWKL